MYLKVYYRNGKDTTEADVADIQQHLDNQGLGDSEIHFTLGHAAVEFPAGTTYQQNRALAQELTDAGYETE